MENNCQLYNADCLKILEKIDKEKFDMIFVDPPYNIGINYGDGNENDKLCDVQFLSWCKKIIEECYRVCSQNGAFWWMINDEYAAETNIIIKQVGFKIRNWIKWYETFGVNCKNKFNRTSRHIFYCVKNPKQFTFNINAVSRLSDRQLKYKDKRANPNGKIWDDIWKIKRLCGTHQERIKGFPTQLPIELLKPIVLCSTNERDTILDPMMGSGTVGYVALKYNRNFVGIELRKQFFDKAQERLYG